MMAQQPPPSVDWRAVGEVLRAFGGVVAESVARTAAVVTHTFAPLATLQDASRARDEMRQRGLRLTDQRFKLATRIRLARTLRHADANGLAVVNPDEYVLVPHITSQWQGADGTNDGISTP